MTEELLTTCDFSVLVSKDLYKLSLESQEGKLFKNKAINCNLKINHLKGLYSCMYSVLATQTDLVQVYERKFLNIR